MPSFGLSDLICMVNDSLGKWRIGTKSRGLGSLPLRIQFTLSAAAVAVHFHHHAPSPLRHCLDSGHDSPGACLGVCGDFGREHGGCDYTRVRRSIAHRWERLPELLLSRCDAFVRGAMPGSGERRRITDAPYRATHRATRHHRSRSRDRAVRQSTIHPDPLRPPIV
jgi:hypothetical protein